VHRLSDRYALSYGIQGLSFTSTALFLQLQQLLLLGPSSPSRLSSGMAGLAFFSLSARVHLALVVQMLHVLGVDLPLVLAKFGECHLGAARHLQRSMLLISQRTHFKAKSATRH
jgi:hypothetical protein